MKLLGTFFAEGSFKKIIVDTIQIIIVCVILFTVLPQTATFLHLASVHKSAFQIILHSSIAWFLVIFFRTTLKVYKQPWNKTRPIYFVHIIIADIMAGIIFYIIADFLIKSRYPFLLDFALFAMIDVVTLFFRLLYNGIVDEYGYTEE